MSPIRPTRVQMFMQMAHIVADRSTCKRAHVGAVIVRDRSIVAMGYNGSPPNQPHCYDVGCEMEHEHCVRTIHAEANAIAWAARAGTSVKGSTLYVTHSPCRTCARLLMSAGVGSVVFGAAYDLEEINFLVRSGIACEQFVIPESF